MPKFTSPLDGVRVAAPCSADWERMTGDERVRFCGECSLNVYNLSAMTRREAEALVTSAEGRLCVRYYRRKDGTILTRNCPTGLRALKRRVAGVARAAASAALSFAAGVAAFVGIGLPHGYCGERFNEHSLAAPAQPDLPQDRAAARPAHPEIVEVVQGGTLPVEAEEGWLEGKMELADEPHGVVAGRIMPIRRKYRR